jgi:glycosyltransferase involved in cell wall biosynthesis
MFCALKKLEGLKCQKFDDKRIQMKTRIRLTDWPPNTLSVCMIVKNEEENVGECLETLKDFADQVVVVDTGSTDRTVEIAEKYGIAVIRSDWRGDFSYSRNISLDHATSQWVLWLDADDRVPLSEAEKFKRLKTAPPDRAFYLKVRNVRPGGFGEQWYQLRMFPNHPEIRFERKVHEQVGFAIKKLKMPVFRVDVRIDHIGYDNPEVKRKKALRNREILLSEFPRYRRDPAYVSSIGDSHFLTEDFEAAIQWYQRVLEIPDGERKQPEIFRQMPTSIALSYERLGDWGNAHQWIEKEIQASPQKIDSLFLAAGLREKIGDLAGAAALYERIIQIPANYTSYAADLEGLKAKSLISLGNICKKRERFDEAEKAFRMCLEKYPQVLNSYSELGELLLKRGKLNEAADLFIGSIKRHHGADSKAYFGLAKALALMGQLEEAARVLEEAKTLYASHSQISAAAQIQQ